MNDVAKLFSYKPHVDGLRALAVLFVFLFHINPELFPGGYLGVDVFFVLSGFVITQSLYKTYIKTGAFDIKNFYIRRFKRLYPALLVMIATTTVVYIFWGFLWDTNLYLKSALSAIFASSNLYFLFNGAEYFHQGLINPMLHTWSLGVEEQFYLLYPVALAGLFWVTRVYKKSLAFVASVLFGASLMLYGFLYLSSHPIIGNFYFPFARFWEISIGCFLFFVYLLYRKKLNVLFSAVASWTALFLLFALQFNQGFIADMKTQTLLAVLATATLLFVGIYREKSLYGLFEVRPMMYIGNISYSLYLWHFPVIYFTGLYMEGVIHILASILLTLVFSIVSYRYIETPLRHSERFGIFLERSFKKVAYVIVSIAALVVFVGVGNVAFFINTSFNTISTEVKNINFIEKNFQLGERVSFDYQLNKKNVSDCIHQKENLTVNSFGLYSECLKVKNDETLFYVTGDSHAMHFLPMFDSAKEVDNLYFVGMKRQLIVNENPKYFDPEELNIFLINKQEELRMLKDEFRNIVYVTSLYLEPMSNQSDVIENSLKRYIEAFPLDVKLVFVAPTPVFRGGPESCVILGKYCVIDKAIDKIRVEKVMSILERLSETYNNVSIFNPYEVLCPFDECRIYEKERDFLRYRDDDHISIEQSTALAPFFVEWFLSAFAD